MNLKLSTTRIGLYGILVQSYDSNYVFRSEGLIPDNKTIKIPFEFINRFILSSITTLDGGTFYFQPNSKIDDITIGILIKICKRLYPDYNCNFDIQDESVDDFIFSRLDTIPLHIIQKNVKEIESEELDYWICALILSLILYYKYNTLQMLLEFLTI